MMNSTTLNSVFERFVKYARNELALIKQIANSEVYQNGAYVDIGKLKRIHIKAESTGSFKYGPNGDQYLYYKLLVFQNGRITDAKQLKIYEALKARFHEKEVLVLFLPGTVKVHEKAIRVARNLRLNKTKMFVVEGIVNGDKIQNRWFENKNCRFFSVSHISNNLYRLKCIATPTEEMVPL